MAIMSKKCCLTDVKKFFKVAICESSQVNF